MSDQIVHISDATFDEEVLNCGTPGISRLLGRVVRPLQNDRTSA